MPQGPSSSTAELSHAPEPTVVRAFAGLGYDVARVLGRGGFGTVYAATRRRDGLCVAIKVALREQLGGAERLQREARVLETVGAPHVPTVYERGAVAGQFYVAMEYIPGATLAERLVAREGAVSLAAFAGVARALLDAVEALHACGVVHRDLKPENVLLTSEGRARIVDFGQARTMDLEAELGEGAADDDVGTAEYMAPEQCEGLTDVDRRTDIYALGVLFYELLAGAPPFWGASADVRDAHRSRRPAPLVQVGVPSALDEVVRRCLAKERARRFDDVGALRAALEQALASAERAEAPSVSTSSSQLVAPVAPAAAEVQRPASTSQKQTVGLVFFQSGVGVSGVQPALAASGGQLVHTSGAQFVAAFGHEAGDNPARMALMAARRLLAGKLSTRLVVDVASVAVQQRPDGSRRLFSPVFTRKDRLPASTDPLGIALTSAALEVLPHLRVLPVDGRADRFLLDVAPAPMEPTTFGVQLLPLVGRERELGMLRESAQRALAGREPTLVTVDAEPGYGRSHLAGALAQQVERAFPAVEVVRLMAQEALLGALSATLPELLRRVLALPADAPADAGRAQLAERLGERVSEQSWAAVALALGWIDASHPEVARLSAAPGALRVAAARAAGEGLRKAAERGGLALVLDDAHLADEATLDALEYATLREAGAPIWICVLVRPSFERARPTWGSRAAAAPRLTLSPLAPAEAAELARRLLLPAEHVPPTVLTQLTERTQGIPRLLVELVRGLKRDGLVRRSERGLGYYVATEALEKLPDLPIVQWTATREVEALPPQLAGHARLASVLGASFTTHEMEALLSILELEGAAEDVQLDASVGVQRLIEAGVLVRHRSGRVDFRHALLRGTIYQLIPERRRAQLHRAAFRTYQTLAMPYDQRLPRLALHAAECGERESAAAAYLELAERAVRGHAYLEAEAAFGGALRNLPADGDPRVARGLRGRGLMRFRLGRHEDALKDLRQARAVACALALGEEELELLLDEATVLDWTLDLAQSAELVREVERRGGMRSLLLDARLAMGIARVHHRSGDAESCVRLGTEAAARAEALGDAGYETRVISLMMVAPDCAGIGKLDAAERTFEAAIESARERGDMLHLGGALLNRALLWFAAKDVARLTEDLTRAVQIAREAGLPLLEYIAVWNFAEVAFTLDQLDRAREHTARAIDLARQLWGEHSREHCLGLLLSARLALYAGELGHSAEIVARLRAHLDHGSQGPGRIELLPSEALLLEVVELASRSARESEWEQLEKRSEGIALAWGDEVEALEARALAAFRNGLVERSGSLLERALRLSATNSNLLTERIQRRAVQLFGTARPSGLPTRERAG